MPDETPRSAPGNRRDHRRSPLPPAWWGQLDRQDLPDGDGEPDPADGWDARRPAPPTRWALPALWRSWSLNLAVLAAACAIVIIGVGATTPRNVVAAILVFGVPVALVAVAATVIVRRFG